MEGQEEEVQVGSYKITKTLGKGTFGKVRIAIHMPTQEKVAVKILEKQLIKDPSDVERISREIKILKKVQHPFIIMLYQIVETESRLYLFMEYAGEGDLFNKICEEKKIKQNVASRYYLQLLHGLKYLHHSGITHRDLKPENLLLENNQVKIADFGLGNFFDSTIQLKTACGSPCYAAPQMISKLKYDPPKVDVWSSGVVLYAMVMGYLPFQDANVNNLYSKIKKGQFRIPDWVSLQLKQLLKGILNIDPSTRFSVEQILNHSWIKKHNQRIDIVPIIKTDTDIISKVSFQFKLDKDKLVKALNTKKHNSLTTTYFLWSKKQERERRTQTRHIFNSTLETKKDIQSRQVLKKETVQPEKLEEKTKQSKISQITQSTEQSQQKQDIRNLQIQNTSKVSNNLQTPIKNDGDSQKTTQNKQIIIEDQSTISKQNISIAESVVNTVNVKPIKQTATTESKVTKQQKNSKIQEKPEKNIKQIKPILIQQQVKVEFQITKKKQIDKHPLRKVPRMDIENMKKTATRLYERSGSRETQVSVRLTAARKNKLLLKRVQKKPRLYNINFFFEGHVEDLRDFVKKLQPKNLNIAVQYFQVYPSCFYILKSNMDIVNLQKGLRQRIMKV